MEKLTYKGLSLRTTKKAMTGILGSPDRIENRKSIQPKKEGGFGKEIVYQIYTYHVGKGFLYFFVYKNRAVI